MSAADDAKAARAAVYRDAVRGMRVATAWIVVLSGLLVAFVAAAILALLGGPPVWFAITGVLALAATWLSAWHFKRRSARSSEVMGNVIDAELREFNEGEQ